jgi:hypothetical protein
LARGQSFSNILVDDNAYRPTPEEWLTLPPETGYAAARISVHYFVGSDS